MTLDTLTVGALVVVLEGEARFGARVLEILPGAARGGGLARVRGIGLDRRAPRWGTEWLAPLADVRPAE